MARRQRSRSSTKGHAVSANDTQNERQGIHAPAPKADPQDLVTIRSAKDGSRAMWGAAPAPREGRQAAATMGFAGAGGRELLACWRKEQARDAQNHLHRAHGILTKKPALATQAAFAVPPALAPFGAQAGAGYALVEPELSPRPAEGSGDSPQPRWLLPLWLLPLRPAELQWIQGGAGVGAFLRAAREAGADLFDWDRPALDLSPR